MEREESQESCWLISSPRKLNVFVTKYQCCSSNLSPNSSQTYQTPSFMFAVWQFPKFRIKIGNKTVLKTITWSAVVSGGVVSANKISCCVDSWYQPPPVRPAWQAYKFIALNICSYTDSPPLIITVPHIFNNNQNFSGYTSPSDITIPFIIPQYSNCHSSHSIWNSSVRDILD